MAWEQVAEPQTEALVALEKPTRPTLNDGLFRLSYSGSSTLIECEQKYVWGRVKKVAEDPDSPDSHALAFGSAFHYVCEHTLHCRTPDVPKLAQEALALYDLDGQDYAALAACLMAYFALHEASGLACIACEIMVQIEGYYLGYIDAILQAPDGGWWICDLKTASQVNQTTFRKLQRDPQLCLYANLHGQVANILNLDPALFQGCVYRSTVKPRAKHKPGESIRDYCKRAEVSSWSVYVRRDELQIEEALANFDHLFRRAVELKNGAKPLRNYAACSNWNRHCEFWSQCHGQTYSESTPQHLHSNHRRTAAPPTLLPDGVIKENGMKIQHKVDSLMNILVVQIEDEQGKTRPYFFNFPQEPQGRYAQICETCVAEAITRHEAWVSGKSQNFAEVSSSVASTPAVVEAATETDASPARKKRSAAAAEQAPEQTETKPAVAKKKPADKPKPVEVLFSKEDLPKRAFGKIITSKLGKDWSKDPDNKEEVAAIAKKLEEEGVVVAIDGVIQESFEARVIEELEDVYDFS